ncbi:MAG: hypothetical protein Q9157_005198 [Trypethelium eluteriae]
MTSMMKYSEIINHLELEQRLDERQGLVHNWPEVGLIEVHKGIVETFYEFVMDVPACMQFFSDFRSNTYFCLNLPTTILTRFISDIGADSILANRLFYLDIILADEIMRKWQRDMEEPRETLKTLVRAMRVAVQKPRRLICTGKNV